MTMDPVHATSVAIDGRGVLIEGPSGAGKSDLALRLIDRGAMLVSDDYTQLAVADGALVASAPATIAGLIEVHGLGIVATPHVSGVPVAMIVRLTAAPERMPPCEKRTVAGVSVPVVAVDPVLPSAPIKVEWALRQPARGAA